MHHTILDSSIQSNTKYFKQCPKVSTGESRRKHVPTPMHRLMGGTRKLITKTYIKWHVISHCHHRYARQDIHQDFSKSLKTQSDKITSKGKLNPLQERR